MSSSSLSSASTEYCSTSNDWNRQYAAGTAGEIQTSPVTLGASVTQPVLKSNSTPPPSNRHSKQCNTTHSHSYNRPLHFHYLTACLLLTVLLLATPLQATNSDKIDAILLSIPTQHKIPDTTATVGKIFIFEIPKGTYNGNISDIKVSRQNQQSLPPWLSFDSLTRTFYGIPLQEDIDTVYISVNVYLDEDDWVTSQEIFSIEVLPTTTLSSSSLQAVDGFNIANIEAFRNEVPWTSFCSEGFSLYPLQCPSGSSTVQANVHINCDIISTSPTERISIILSVSQLLAVCPLQLTLYAENDNVMAFIIAEDRVGNPMANMITVSLLIHCDGSNLYPIIIQDAVQLLEGILNTTVLNNTLTLQAWSITSSNANSHEIVSPRRVRRQIPPPDDPTTSSDEFMTESIPFLTSSIVPFPSRVTSLPILIVTSEIATSDDFPSLSIIESSSPDFFISPTTTVLRSSSSLISNEFSSLMMPRNMSSYSDLISNLDPIMTASSDFLFPSSTSSREISMTDPLPSSAEPIPSIPTDILSSSSDFIMSSFMESTASTFIFDSPTSSLLEPTSVVSSSIITSSSDFYLSSSQLLSSSKDLFTTSIFESPTPSILLPETSSDMLFESPTLSSLLFETSSMSFILESSSELFESPTPTLFPDTSSSEIILETTLTPISSSSDIFESPTPSSIQPSSSSDDIFEEPTSSSISISIETSSFISPIPPSPSEDLTPIPSPTDKFSSSPSFSLGSRDEITSSSEFESSLILLFSSSSEIISELLPTSSIEEPVTTVPSIEESLTAVTSIAESSTAIPSIDETFTAVTSIEESSTALPSIEEPFTSVTSIFISSTSTTNEFPSSSFTDLSSSVFTESFSMDISSIVPSPPSTQTPTPSSIHGSPFTSITSELFSSSSVESSFEYESFSTPFVSESTSSRPFQSSSIDMTRSLPLSESTTTIVSSPVTSSEITSGSEFSTFLPTSTQESMSLSVSISPSSILPSVITSSFIEESSSFDLSSQFSISPTEVISSIEISSTEILSSTITSSRDISPSSTEILSSTITSSIDISPSSTKILSSTITSSIDISPSSTEILSSTITSSIDISPSSTEILSSTITSSIDISPSSTEILSSTITSSIDISPSSTEILSSTITSSSEAPSPSPTNNVPLLLNPIGALLVQEGVTFSHSIPDDMFYDIEDGYNLTLRLQSEANWIEIMNQNAIVGLPLSTEIIGRYITRYEIEIRAYDHNGEFASEIITVSVNPRHSLLPDNYIQVTINENFTNFNENVTAKVDLITKLGVSNPNDIYVYSLTSGSVVISYTNISIRRDDCTEFNNFVNSIDHSRNYTDAFRAQINPYIPMGSLKVFGTCNRSVGTYETIQPTIEMIDDPISEQMIFLAVVIPLVAIACILLVLCLAVFLTYRWRRMERNYIQHDEQKILLNRKPIVFLDESESLSRSRRPTILTGRSRGSGYHSLVNTESEGLDDTFTTIPEQDTVSVTDEALEFPFVEISEPSRPNAPPPYRLPPQLR